MGNTRVRWIIAYVAAAAVLLAGIVVVIERRGDDKPTASVAELPDLAPMPFPATLRLQGSSQGSIGTQFTLSSQSDSDRPVAKVDLYDGATRISTTSPGSGGGGDTGAALTFPALSAGPHALHAEITDDKGRVSLTEVVPVSVHPAPIPGAVELEGTKPPADPTTPGETPDPGSVAVPVPHDEGETPAGLAERLHVDPAQIGLGSQQGGSVVPIPDLGADDPIPPNAITVVRVPFDNGVKATLSDVTKVVNGNALAGSKLKLSGKADGCGVALSATGSDGPVYFFDGNAGVPGWASVGQTDGDGTLALPAPAPGAHTYFARTDKLKSSIVSVTVPLKCSADVGWKGNAKIIDGVLYLPAEAVGPVSLYLTLDGGTGVRIPEKYGFSAGYETDIADKLPVLAGSSVRLEVWRNTEFNAGKVAEGSLTVPDGSSLAEIIGEPGIIELTATAPKGVSSGASAVVQSFQLDHDDATFTFDWEAQSSRVEEVLYRVYRGPAAPDSLAGPAIFASGISERSSGGGDDGTPSKGSFTIDTADVPGHEEVAARNEQLAKDPNGPAPTAGGATKGKIVAYQPPAVPTTLGSLKDFTASKPVAPGSNIDPAMLQPSSMLPAAGESIFIDVVSNPSGEAIGTASNQVAIGLPTPVPAESADDGVTIVADQLDFDPGRAPNPNLGNCAVVTLPPPAAPGTPAASDPFGPPPAGQLAPITPATFYTAGDGTYCVVPKPPESCSLEDIPVVGSYACDLAELAEDGINTFISVLSQFYDLGSQIYNGAINGVVSIIAKFNPICLALDAADDTAGDDCEMVAGIVAKAAISAVLSSFGLPPSLPSLDALKAIGQGELAGLAVELMKQVGVPCDAIKPSPELSDAIKTAGGELGAGAEAEAISDPCLAIASAVLKSVTAQITSATTGQMAASTGLPDFSYLPGFSIQPDQRSLTVPMTVTYKASVAKADADATGLTCAVMLLPSAPSKGKPFPWPFTFYSYGSVQTFKLTEDDPADGKGSFSGDAVLTTYTGTLAGQTEFLQDLTVEMKVRPMSPCIGGEATATETVRPFEP